MEPEKYWLKFILSGKAEDYLKYSDAKKEKDEAVDKYPFFNRGTGNSTEQYR